MIGGLPSLTQVRTDATYPAGFMDVVQIDKTDEHFRLVYDSKGRFVVHRITPEEVSTRGGTCTADVLRVCMRERAGDPPGLHTAMP
jgi:Ribosomal family S4e